MEQRIRAASAAIAFAHALGREVLSVYEHEGRRDNRIRVRVTGSITTVTTSKVNATSPVRSRVYITSVRSRIGY